MKNITTIIESYREKFKHSWNFRLHQKEHEQFIRQSIEEILDEIVINNAIKKQIINLKK